MHFIKKHLGSIPRYIKPITNLAWPFKQVSLSVVLSIVRRLSSQIVETVKLEKYTVEPLRNGHRQDRGKCLL